MARPGISPVRIDPTTDKNFSALRSVLSGGVDLTNLNVQTIEGTTSDTSDGVKKFQHSMSPQPAGWFPLVGDVYVQEITSEYIDIRSTKPGVNFTLILIGGSQVAPTTKAQIGNSAYKTTEEQAASQGGIAGVLENFGSDVFFQNLEPTTASQSALYVQCVEQDDNYWYFTIRAGGTSGVGEYLSRYHKTAGTKDVLQLTTGAGTNRNLGHMEIVGDQMYVFRSAPNSGVVEWFQVDLPTFTKVADLGATCNTITFGRVTSIISDGTNFYIGGGTTTDFTNSGSDAIVIRVPHNSIPFSLGGTLFNGVVVHSNDSSHVTGMTLAGTSLWVSVFRTTSEGYLVEMTQATPPVVIQDFDTAEHRWQLGTPVHYEGYLFMTGAYVPSGASASDAAGRGGLVAFEIASSTFYYKPVHPSSHVDSQADYPGKLQLLSLSLFGLNLIWIAPTDQNLGGASVLHAFNLETLEVSSYALPPFLSFSNLMMGNQSTAPVYPKYLWYDEDQEQILVFAVADNASQSPSPAFIRVALPTEVDFGSLFF
jgi:hypothetical protein